VGSDHCERVVGQTHSLRTALVNGHARAGNTPTALPSNAVPWHAMIRFPAVPTLSAVPQRFRGRRPEPPSRLPEWARALITTPPSIQSDHSAYSIWSHTSIGSVASAFSLGSVMSAGSALSVGSLASIGSAGSILSIGSSGSILSIGASGGFLQVGGGHRSHEAAPPDAPVAEATVRKLSGFLAVAAIVSAPFSRPAAA
jgi:hypothetical protein